MISPIIKTIDVPCAADRAFDIFVTRIASWWPMDRHAVSAAAGKAALAVTIEPHVGGAVYETMYDGTRSDWGKVLEFEVGRNLAMTWHPGSNADSATRVDIQFDAINEAKTRVTLTHSGWEVWADEAHAKRENYDSGWDFVLGERYAAAVA
ncbi:SRPBCC domain-containing protein [uncultured Tateyamaria sp.]|uniref:SRPBCC domain-containing protein n=1 Tax=uncultured Tateyamaria sp. TaxID=455651 RepID=UPI002639C839|nr:SRPBCC domain-containing protein [uncultured Tateyamaria sp.]